MSDQPPRDLVKPAPGRTATPEGAGVTAATAAGQAARQARLAGALRDNLHRRKAQSRARRPPGDGPAADEG